MKCEECGGTGKVQKWFYERTGFGKCEKVCGDVKCEWCNGTGEVEMTEQEYIQTCNTEQLAEWLVEHIDCAICCCKKDLCCKDYDSCKLTFVEWLKQPHKPQKQDDYPCNVKGCSLETRQACCGCPDYFEWEKQHKE